MLTTTLKQTMCQKKIKLVFGLKKQDKKTMGSLARRLELNRYNLHYF